MKTSRIHQMMRMTFQLTKMRMGCINVTVSGAEISGINQLLVFY